MWAAVGLVAIWNISKVYHFINMYIFVAIIVFDNYDFTLLNGTNNKQVDLVLES